MEISQQIRIGLKVRVGLLVGVLGLQVGKTYLLKFDVLNYVSGGVDGFLGYTKNDGKIYATSNGSFEVLITLSNVSQDFVRFHSVGTFVGSIDNVSVKEYITETNTPRLDYSTGAEAFLLEPQSTNLIPYSEDFSDASWVKQQTTITQNATISPSGLIDASMISEDNTNNYHRIRRNISLSVDATLSIFAKKGTNDKFLLWSGSNGVGFDLTLGTINNVSGLTPPSSSSIKDFGNGWYRCSITDNSISAFEVFSLQDFSGFIYQGSSTNNFYIWGAQSEQQSYTTSYIPTSGTTVTRNQETCINATPEINSEEGVLYFEAAAENITTFKNISINDGGTTNRINLYIYSSSIVVNFDVGGVNQASLAYSIPNVTIFNKFAFSYKLNEFKLFVNGVQRAIDTSGAVPAAGTFNQLSFNDGFLSKFFGNTKDVQVYTKALSDAELIKLTT
jgi:hypothetical protein